MIKAKDEQREFRVRLSEKELEDLLLAIDICCRQLVKQHILTEKAKDDFLKQCDFDTNRTPETSQKWKTFLDEIFSVEAEIRRLESVETEFKALLRGKGCGRRPKTNFFKERLWDTTFLNEMKDQILKDRCVEKLKGG
jgi:hypothetical protein